MVIEREMLGSWCEGFNACITAVMSNLWLSSCMQQKLNVSVLRSSAETGLSYVTFREIGQSHVRVHGIDLGVCPRPCQSMARKPRRSMYRFTACSASLST